MKGDEQLNRMCIYIRGSRHTVHNRNNNILYALIYGYIGLWVGCRAVNRMCAAGECAGETGTKKGTKWIGQQTAAVSDHSRSGCGGWAPGITVCDILEQECMKATHGGAGSGGCVMTDDRAVSHL